MLESFSEASIVVGMEMGEEIHLTVGYGAVLKSVYGEGCTL